MSLPSGDLHTLTRFDYDAHGRLVRAEWQYHELDVSTRGAVRTYAYSSDGRLASEALDENLDGKADETFDYEYDELGRIARVRSLVSAQRGVSDLTYDDAGRRIRQDWRRGTSVTATETVAYSPDAKERVRRWSAASDTRGRVVREELDHRNQILRLHVRDEGAPERLVLDVKHDAEGRALAVTHYAAEGHVESVVHNKYDATGRQVGASHEYRGQLSTATTYSYSGAWKAAQCGILPGMPDVTERVP